MCIYIFIWSCPHYLPFISLRCPVLIPVPVTLPLTVSMQHSLSPPAPVYRQIELDDWFLGSKYGGM